MNRMLVPLLLSIPLLAVPAGATETLREQSERELDARGISSIAVENPRGSVRVTAGAAGRIRVTALKICRGHDAETAREFARETRVSLSTQGGRCKVEVRYPQHRQVKVGIWQMMSGDFDFPGVEVRLAIEVPRELPVSLRSTSGDLITEDLAGRQELDTTSGEIDVSVAGGAVRASTTSGDVRVSARGAARLRERHGGGGGRPARRAHHERRAGGDGGAGFARPRNGERGHPRGARAARHRGHQHQRQHRDA